MGKQVALHSLSSPPISTRSHILCFIGKWERCHRWRRDCPAPSICQGRELLVLIEGRGRASHSSLATSHLSQDCRHFHSPAYTFYNQAHAVYHQCQNTLEFYVLIHLHFPILIVNLLVHHLLGSIHQGIPVSSYRLRVNWLFLGPDSGSGSICLHILWIRANWASSK